MDQKKLPRGLTYEKLCQPNQNIWFLTWVLKQRGCNPDFNQEILSAPFTVRRQYWLNGQLYCLGCFKNGQPHGFDRGWHDNGQLQSENHWQNGLQDGFSRGWYSNGQLGGEEEWQNGQLHCLSRIWHRNGQLGWEAIEWQNGQLISKNYFQKN